MNGWIESGNVVKFSNGMTKLSDTIIRTEYTNDAIVICNSISGEKAGLCVTENRVGVGLRPRPFASLDVNGVIFGNDRLELCTGNHPISFPRMVADPKSLYFVNAQHRSPVCVDGERGCLVADNVLARQAMGVLEEVIPIAVGNVITTESVATDIEMNSQTFNKVFALDASVSIDGFVTKVVQFTPIPNNEGVNVTLVPPIPSNIVSNSIINVTPISKALTVSQTNERKSCSIVHVTREPTKMDEYTWKIYGKGVEADIKCLADKYVAVSKSKLHNYQKIVIIKDVWILLDDDGGNLIEMTVVAPSLKNPLDMSEFVAGTDLYMYHLS
jgi:hypothetical protein